MHTHVHDYESAQHFVDHFSVHVHTDAQLPTPDVLLAVIKQVWADIRDYTIALCQALSKDLEPLFVLDRALTLGGANAADICGMWAQAKPIVTLIVNFPFFPSRWKAPIQALIGLLNAFCPAQ